MSKSCIITGGSGLVGSNFKDGIKINSSHCDLMNYDESYNKIKSFNPDSIIHCAAMVGGLYDPTELGIRDKMTAAKELLDRAGLVKTEKMQVESTGGVMLLPPKNEN